MGHQNRLSAVIWPTSGPFPVIFRTYLNIGFRSTFLRRVPILKHLSDYEVAKIAHVAEKETYDAGQYIVREKSVGDTFYIIVRGSCDVFQLQSNNTQKLINKLKAGEHFGEKALLNDNDLRNDIQSNLILRSRCPT